MTTSTMFRSLAGLALSLALGLVLGCDGSQPPPDEPSGVKPPPTAPAGTASGGPDGTFDHDNNLDKDPWELLKQMEEEGPPEFSARLHSCPKMRYRTIGAVLTSRGVNLAGTGNSAGGIYTTSDQALGIANYGARVPEAVELTTASAAKLFDIWVAAAPELIAGMQNRPACQLGGQGVSLFNAQGQCNADGITCLIGVPATVTHVELCNEIVAKAQTPEQGRVLAVASLAAAAHTCE
jgi:hypothetical protein